MRAHDESNDDIKSVEEEKKTLEKHYFFCHFRPIYDCEYIYGRATAVAVAARIKRQRPYEGTMLYEENH